MCVVGVTSVASFKIGGWCRQLTPRRRHQRLSEPTFIYPHLNDGQRGNDLKTDKEKSYFFEDEVVSQKKCVYCHDTDHVHLYPEQVMGEEVAFGEWREKRGKSVDGSQLKITVAVSTICHRPNADEM